MKILCVFGTRPEAIKMAPVIKELSLYPNINCVTCVTGQHYQMLNQVLDFFRIKPDFDLKLMKENQTLATLTADIITTVTSVINEVRPNLILVHGDTTTAMATSIASFYSKTPLGHVEAGLRTNNIYSPFPEEFNRQIISKIAKIHFAPTEYSKNNLINEGASLDSISVTGNTVIDALYLALNTLENNPSSHDNAILLLNKNLGFDITKDKYLLVTGHRRENFGENIISICQALTFIAKNNPKLNIIYPVHLNPNIEQPVKKQLGSIKNISLIEPQDYVNFILLMKYCYLILTDSGGIQEEGPSMKKPVLVMRDTTERPEAVEAGTVKLIGASSEKIIQGIQLLLDSEEEYRKMITADNPYGDGYAAKKIISYIMNKNIEAMNE